MQAIRTEFTYFLAALQVLTRLPLPTQDGFSAAWLERSVKYFPLAGVCAGALCAAVLWICSALWSEPLPALLAVAAGIALTGGLHEDGLADFFDALGGATTEARLAIMKDSRIGAYGALALGIGIAIKVLALAALPVSAGVAAIIAAHAGGRFATVAVISTLPYAGELAAAKIKPLGSDLTAADVFVAAGIAILPNLLIPWSMALAALSAGSIAAVLQAILARRLLGGYTGDVLGAAEQCFEIAFLLGAAAAI